MQIPKDIVSQWPGCVAEWCAGVEPAEPPRAVDRAFRALHRLWPEYVKGMHGQATRGLAIVAPAVSLGLTLAACESLKEFELVRGVLHQLLPQHVGS
jgi:hypothetical protein